MGFLSLSFVFVVVAAAEIEATASRDVGDEGELGEGVADDPCGWGLCVWRWKVEDDGGGGRFSISIGAGAETGCGWCRGAYGLLLLVVVVVDRGDRCGDDDLDNVTTFFLAYGLL